MGGELLDKIKEKANGLKEKFEPLIKDVISAAKEKLDEIMPHLRDLGERMFDYLRRERPDERLGAAFRELPTPAMTPRAAFGRIVTGDVEMVPSEALAGRIPANSLIPYPPGIPLLISGERFGGDDSPHLAYLRSLAAWDRAFPGFEHVTEGVEIVDGVYRVMCVKE